MELEGTEDEIGEKVDSLFNEVSEVFSSSSSTQNLKTDGPSAIQDPLSGILGEKGGLPIIAAKVGSRKGIGLLLYPERTLTPEQLEHSLGQSGIPTTGHFLLSRLSELRKNGYLVKTDEGTWGLTTLGRNWIKEKIAPSLRVGDQ
jgi:hypothetical protein